MNYKRGLWLGRRGAFPFICFCESLFLIASFGFFKQQLHCLMLFYCWNCPQRWLVLTLDIRKNARNWMLYSINRYKSKISIYIILILVQKNTEELYQLILLIWELHPLNSGVSVVIVNVARHPKIWIVSLANSKSWDLDKLLSNFYLPHHMSLVQFFTKHYPILGFPALF